MQGQTLCAVLLVFVAVVDASAHHSRAAFYDSSRIIETEGVVTRVLWRNPHARFAANAIEVHNVLLADGRELLIQVTARPRWTEDVQGLEVSGFAESDVQLLERFALSADQRRLDYTLTVTDALTFAPPLVVRRHWVWLPGETVEPWLCADDNE